LIGSVTVVRDAPTGTVTFLFTDVEGSTRRWEQEPAAMREALANHDEILRRAIERHGGVVFATGGDGFAAAFGRAGDAVAGAASAQAELQATDSLRVRMGMHTGEAVERGGDYYGPTVNRAARLMAVAHGGQVLLSRATQELVSGCELVDLGEHRLRDLSRAEHVFQLAAPGLWNEFPALRSLDAFAGNLPLQLTSFVGRDEELAAVTAAVSDARLVTIIGVGGVGKTRLALQAGAELINEYRDGVWICELATANEEESVEQVVAGSLGVTPQPGVTLTQSTVEFLRNKEMLLLLDNCEHVLDAVGELADSILRACSAVRVVATSREPLAIDGERIFPLRSLSLVRTPDDPQSWMASDAVRLFEDRARAARPGFVVDEGNIDPVAETCRRLDGIPLAIELAAARVVAMSPRELAELLDERFRLLTGGRRGSLERHQTLRATVEWSYSLLTDTERAVFDRLAVCAGCDAAGARVIASADDLDAWSVLDAVEALVRKSMLVVEEQADASTRYQQLETLRQFGLERLEQAGTLDAARRRHAAYFAEFAERIGPDLLGPDELRVRVGLYAELENLRAACTWALDRDDRGDAELGVRILSALAEDWCMGSRVRLALPTPARAIDAARASTPGRRAAVLSAAAYEAQSRSDYATAAALGREALADGISPDCPTPYRVFFAAASDGQSTEPEAIPMIEAAIPGLEANGTPDAELARIWGQLVQASVRAGDDDGAHRYAERAQQLADRSRNPSTIAHVAYYVGTMWAVVDPPRAIRAYKRGIELGRSGTNDATLGAALFQCALLLARDSERCDALTYLRESIALQEHLNQQQQLRGALAYGIEILTILNAPEAAAVLVGAARAGALTQVQGMDMPRERLQQGSSPLRTMLTKEQLTACFARGAAMAMDELIAWTIRTLDALIDATVDQYPTGTLNDQ
jgi:predicted ATPase/class 3 adenylate cyclase